MNITLERSLRQLNKAHVTDGELKFLLRGRSMDGQKAIIKRAVSEEVVVRLRRGLYWVSDFVTTTKPHERELGCLMYGDACVSLESALSFHGMIPEAVYTTTCATPLRNRDFRTKLGAFSFCHVPAKNFLVGTKRLELYGTAFFMATPWRALTDYVYCYKKFWASLSELEEDIRLNVDEFPKLSKKLMSQLIAYYDCKRVTLFLTSMMREQNHG